MGLRWLQLEQRTSTDTIDDYVQRVFVHLWRDSGTIDSAQDIEPLLLAINGLQANFDKAGQDLALIDGWQKYSRSQGIEHLDAARAAAQSQSISMAPTFVLGSEPFQGRAQLPLITARLKAGI